MLWSSSDSDTARQRRAIADAVASQLTDLDVAMSVALVPNLPQGNGEILQQNARKTAEELGVSGVFWYTSETDNTVAHLNLYIKLSDGEWMIQRVLDLESVQGLAETLAIIMRSVLYVTLSQVGVGGDEGEKTSNAKGEPNPLDAYVNADTPVQHLEPSPEPSQEDISSTAQLRITTAYLLGWTSTRTSPSQGLDVTVGVGIVPWLTVFAGYALLRRIKAEHHGILISVWRHPVRLGIETTMKRNRWTIGASLAASLDYVSWDLVEISPGMVAGEGDAQLELSGVALIVGTFRLYKRSWLFASAGLEFFAIRPRFIVRTALANEEAYNPWPVQPMALIGILLDIM